MTGQWEDCPCCGAPAFRSGSLQDDGTPVPCGCDCWVSIGDNGHGALVGYIAMGDGPCPACDVREEWLDGPDSEAVRAARGEGQGAVLENAYERGFVHGFDDGWASAKRDDESEGA